MQDFVYLAKFVINNNSGNTEFIDRQQQQLVLFPCVRPWPRNGVIYKPYLLPPTKYCPRAHYKMLSLLRWAHTHTRYVMLYNATRWLDKLFNVWPFSTMKICASEKNLPKLAHNLSKQKISSQKLPKTLICLPK